MSQPCALGQWFTLEYHKAVLKEANLALMSFTNDSLTHSPIIRTFLLRDYSFTHNVRAATAKSAVIMLNLSFPSASCSPTLFVRLRQLWMTIPALRTSIFVLHRSCLPAHPHPPH